MHTSISTWQKARTKHHNRKSTSTVNEYINTKAFHTQAKKTSTINAFTEKDTRTINACISINMTTKKSISLLGLIRLVFLPILFWHYVMHVMHSESCVSSCCLVDCVNLALILPSPLTCVKYGEKKTNKSILWALSALPHSSAVSVLLWLSVYICTEVIVTIRSSLYPDTRI